LNTFYNETMLIGRNTEIHELVVLLTSLDEKSNRLIALEGPIGMGKRSISKFAIKYSQERQKFDGMFELEVGTISTKTSF